MAQASKILTVTVMAALKMNEESVLDMVSKAVTVIALATILIVMENVEVQMVLMSVVYVEVRELKILTVIVMSTR